MTRKRSLHISQKKNNSSFCKKYANGGQQFIKVTGSGICFGMGRHFQGPPQCQKKTWKLMEETRPVSPLLWENLMRVKTINAPTEFETMSFKNADEILKKFLQTCKSLAVSKWTQICGSDVKDRGFFS